MRWLILACCIAGCASFGNLHPPSACRGVGAWPASSPRVARQKQNGRGLGGLIMCKSHGDGESRFGTIPAAGPSAGQGKLGFCRVGSGQARAGWRTVMGMSGNMRRAEEWRKRGDRRWQVENEKRLTGRGLLPMNRLTLAVTLTHTHSHFAHTSLHQHFQHQLELKLMSTSLQHLLKLMPTSFQRPLGPQACLLMRTISNLQG